MEHRLLEWIARDGPIALFFAQLFGIFGLPIPDELLLTVAGALARAGRLRLTTTLAAAVTGCMCGITFSYTLGRMIGLVALRRVVHVSDAAFARSQRWFHRFGRWLLMFGYFIPGVRHVTAIAAGSAPLSYREFAAFAYPGALMWSFLFVMLGYTAGPRWRLAITLARRALPVAALGALAALALVWLVRRRTRAVEGSGSDPM